jgi:tRNA threonylcarbamoyladenosine biosynthesis protein TsaB
MLILTIRTDRPLAEAGLYEGEAELSTTKWKAHRQLSVTIHGKIEKLLSGEKQKWSDIDGVVFFAGPGSFTGLRIGAAVASALAGGLAVPVVSTKGDDWISGGIKELIADKDEKTALPFYGSQPHITKPKK